MNSLKMFCLNVVWTSTKDLIIGFGILLLFSTVLCIGFYLVLWLKEKDITIDWALGTWILCQE